MSTVVSADIGAGNTKVQAIEDGKIILNLVVPSAVGMVGAGALSGFSERSTSPYDIRLTVNNNEYCVSLAPGQNLPRYRRIAPHDDYQCSAQHDALLRAVLRATGLTRIDAMVLGTPVHTYSKHNRHLTKWEGHHDLGSGLWVDIQKVLVVPQPFGSLVAAKSEGIIDSREHVNHLVIDPGFYSLDVLKTRGFELDQAHCFGVPTGTASVYRKIADLLAQTLRKPVNDLDRIEHALRTGHPYMAHGQTVNLGEAYAQQIKAHIEECVMEIYSRLETTEDLSSVLLTGGGCELFYPAIAKVFTGIEIRQMPDPILANVRGYTIAGCHAALG